MDGSANADFERARILGCSSFISFEASAAGSGLVFKSAALISSFSEAFLLANLFFKPPRLTA